MTEKKDKRRINLHSLRALNLGRRTPLSRLTAIQIKRAAGIKRIIGATKSRRVGTLLSGRRRSWVGRRKLDVPLIVRGTSQIIARRTKFPPPPKVQQIIDAYKKRERYKAKPPASWKPERNIIEMYFSSFGKKQMNALKKIDKKWYEHILVLTSQRLRDLHREIYHHFQYSQIYVPKETDALRKNLFASLSSDKSDLPPFYPTHHNQIKLGIGFASSLSYAKYVSVNLQGYQLAHFGKKRSKRTGKPLIDPYAEKNFLDNRKSRVMKELRGIAINGVTNLLQELQMEFKQIIGGRRGLKGLDLANIRKMFVIKNSLNPHGIRDIRVSYQPTRIELTPYQLQRRQAKRFRKLNEHTYYEQDYINF